MMYKVQQFEIQQGEDLKKLLFLKIAIVCFIASFATLTGLSQLFSSNLLAISGVLCFTGAVGSITYYMALTQP